MNLLLNLKGESCKSIDSHRRSVRLCRLGVIFYTTGLFYLAIGDPSLSSSDSIANWESVNLSYLLTHPLKLGYYSQEGRGGSLTTVK